MNNDLDIKEYMDHPWLTGMAGFIYKYCFQPFADAYDSWVQWRTRKFLAENLKG